MLPNVMFQRLRHRLSRCHWGVCFAIVGSGGNHLMALTSCATYETTGAAFCSTFLISTRLARWH